MDKCWMKIGISLMALEKCWCYSWWWTFHDWGELRTVDSLPSRSEMDPHKFKRRRSKLHQIGRKNGGGIRRWNWKFCWLVKIDEIQARRWGIKVVIMRIFLDVRNVLPSECAREQITKIYSVQWCIKGTFIIFHQIVITLHREMMVLLSYWKLSGPNCVIIIESRINKRLSLHLKENSSKIYIYIY